jgi:hypothetical protein
LRSLDDYDVSGHTVQTDNRLQEDSSSLVDAGWSSRFYCVQRHWRLDPTSDDYLVRWTRRLG